MSTALHEVAKALSTAFATIKQTQSLKKAHFDFNTMTGQPVALKCNMVQDNKMTVLVNEQKDYFNNGLSTTFAVAPYASAQEQESDLLAAHNSAFCSVAQAYQGMCKLVGNGLQNADANYSIVFNTPTIEGDTHVAGLVFASNLSKFSQQGVLTSCEKKSKEDCKSAQLNDLESLSESSVITAVLVDQMNMRMRPQLVGDLSK